MILNIGFLPTNFQDSFLDVLYYGNIEWERMPELEETDDDYKIKIIHSEDYETVKNFLNELKELVNTLIQLEADAFTTVQILEVRYFLFDAHNKKQVKLYNKYKNKEIIIDNSLFEMIRYKEYDFFNIGLAWEIFYDRSLTWYYVEFINGYSQLLLSGPKGAFDIYTRDGIIDAFRELISSKGMIYPIRVKNSIQTLSNEFELKPEDIDYNYDDFPRKYSLVKDEFYLCTKNIGLFPPHRNGGCLEINAIVFKKDLKKIASKDYTRRYDDHDWLFIIINGPYKGNYLRHYASRLQGSPDYEASIYEEIDEDALIEQGWIF